MTALSIQAPFPIFTDIDGQPLEAGYIFIGAANLPPIGNPITAYWDAALTQPAAQPIRTIGGYPVNAGMPARLYVNSDYSIQVQNRNGSVVYSAPAATERYSGDVIEITLPSSDVTFLQAGTGAVTRTAQAKMRDVVSVKDFGAVGDGVTDDTTAVLNALTSLSSGGALYFPKGTYKFLRGTGTLLSDTISASNVLIYGDGAASKISGFSAAGTIPNNVGNQFYNVFQATSRSGITIKDMAFEGYTTPVALFSCTNAVVDNIFDNAQLANAGGFMRDKSVYIDKGADVRVVNSRFLNFQFGVYVSGDVTTQASRVIVNACSFEHTTAAGSYTTEFPVGVYWYYSDNCIVNGCTFKNIYSSVDAGSTGTGMGYGVYEGDGLSTAGVISNNTFRYDAKGSKNAIGVYINEMFQCVVSGNSFDVASGARMVEGVRLDSKNQDSKYSITGNTFDIRSTAVSNYSILINDGLGAGTSTRSPKISISGNTISGGLNAIRQDFLGNAELTINGNTIANTTGAGIQLSGSSTVPVKHPMISGNTIVGAGTNAIYFNQRVVSPSIIGNTLLDGNTTNLSGDDGAAIRFTSLSFGSYIANNIIGNTAYGGGLFTWGVQNASNATDRIFKDVAVGNTFLGLTLGEGAQFGRYFSSSPTNGIFDLFYNDFVQNSSLSAAGVPGWYSVRKRIQSLIADASSASTTVRITSTSGMSAGDIVLLLKDSNPYDGDYADSTKWHVDTVASVTNATDFVLTTGIPAGDGTYANGVAVCHFARFKAAAAIAA